jgi:hypothetical protein
MKESEILSLINRDVEIINKWISKEGYKITTHSEDGFKVLALYNPAPTNGDIDCFIKNLIRGKNKDIYNYVTGMYTALNLCK